MSWLITLIVGAVVGVLFGWAMDTNRKIGTWQNVYYGIIGTIVGYWLFVDVLRFGTMNTTIRHFSGVALIWEIIGAIVFLVFINGMILGSMRREGARKSHVYGPGLAKEYQKKCYRDRDKDDENET